MIKHVYNYIYFANVDNVDCICTYSILVNFSIFVGHLGGGPYTSRNKGTLPKTNSKRP